MRVNYVGEAGDPAGSTELIAKIRVARFVEVAIAVAGYTGE